MPRTKNESWQSCPVPQTPLQRGVFIDRCTEWLVHEQVHESDDVRFSPQTRTRWKGTRDTATRPSIPMGISSLDLSIHTLRPCAFCDAQCGSKIIVANPFAHTDLVLVCPKCME